MIVITGATGHVGSALASELAGRGEAVRAITRRPEAARFPSGVEAVYGDFEDPSSLRAALRGAERVFLMSAQAIGSAPVPTHDLALVDACHAAGVRRIVKLSALGGGGTDGSNAVVQWVRQAESAVTGSGLEWTLLRPGRFMSNTLGWAHMIRRGNDISVPLASRPTASIDPADIAAVAALTLTEPGHGGKTYELSGPEALTPADEVSILGAVLERPLRIVPLTDEAERAALLRYGMPEHVIRAIQALGATSHGSEVLPTFESVTGRPARAFIDWARAHRQAFV
jgi:uncharacterized protein YbjT (DUF2867 family)